MPLIELIASLVQARLNCRKAGNTEWFDRHSERLAIIQRDLLPSGGGIDNGTTIDLDRSSADRIILHTAFHHMNESGMYDGWTEHTVTARPSFIGCVSLSISGRNRNDIKDYLANTFDYTLTRTVCETVETVRFADLAECAK